MGILTVANVNEYREKYGNDLREGVTDQEITDKIFERLSEKASIDYFSFYSAFNPEGDYSNINNFRASINDMESSDKDIIQRAYQELQGKGSVRFKDFVNVFAPKDFDTELQKVKEDFNIIGLNIPDIEYSSEEIALLNDINPDTDVNVMEVGFAQSLARDDANEAIAAKVVLDRYFNEDVPIRFGTETEQLEFLNPRTGKYELVNPTGIDEGDLAKIGGYSAFIIPEIFATAIATTTTGPTGGVITSGVSSAFLEAARLAWGHSRYGINQTEDGFKDYLKNEGYDLGKLNAAITATGYTVPKLYQMFKNFKLKGKLDASDFSGQIKDAEAAEKLVSDINNRLTTLGYRKGMKFTLGQTSGDDTFLALQHAYETNPKFGVKGTFNTFNKEQALALNNYMKLITDGYNFKNLSGKDPIGADQVGKMIQNAIIKRLNPRQKALTTALEASENDLTGMVLKLPTGGTKEAGEEIRGIIKTLYDDFEQTYTNKYTELFKIGKGRTVKTDKIKLALKELNQRQKDTFFAQYPNLKTILKMPKGSVVEVNKLKNTLSDLRRFDRQITKGIVPIEGQPVEGATSKLIGSIKEQLKDLGEDDIWYREFLKLDKAYAKNKKMYKGVIANLLETRNGELVLANEDVFRQTFKKGVGQERRIDQIYELLKQRPALIGTYQEQILKSYKQAVDPLDTGKINLKAHQRFLNDYEYALGKFFGGKNGLKQIETVGALAVKVAKNQEKYNKIMKKLGVSTKGKLESMDPDKIFAFVYNQKSPTTLNKVMAIIKEDEQLLNAFQSKAKDDLLMKITNNRNQLDFNKMADYLKNNRQILTKVFADNPTFVNDLYNIRGALELISRKSTQATIGRAESALNDIIRARLGQFTVAGRTFTALKKIVRSDVDKQLAEIITDPNRLKQLLELNKAKYKKAGVLTRAGKDAVVKLFGYNIFDERFFEDDEFTPVMIDLVDSQKMSQNVKEAEEIINLTQNTELDNRFNETVLPQGNISQTQSVNPNFLAQAQAPSGIMQNLSSTEQALLDPMEQVIARRT